MHTGEGDNDRYGKDLIHAVRDTEKEVNNNIFPVQNEGRGKDNLVFFIFAGESVSTWAGWWCGLGQAVAAAGCARMAVTGCHQVAMEC